MYEPFRALDKCDPRFLARVADRLKGSDGEGWAVGDAIEKYLALRQEEEIGPCQPQWPEDTPRPLLTS